MIPINTVSHNNICLSHPQFSLTLPVGSKLALYHPSHLLVDRSDLPPKIDLGYQLQATHPTQVTQSSSLVMFQLPPAPRLTSGHSQSWSSPTGLVTLTTHLGLDKGQSWPQRSQSSSLTQRPNSSTTLLLKSYHQVSALDSWCHL